jgi:hypothetical protein
MNKIIPIISFLLLFTYSLLGQTIVSIGNVASPEGVEVLVPINATINDVGSVNLYLSYDKDVLTFVEVANSSLGAGMIVNQPSDGLINVGWFTGSTPVDIASKILDLKFVYNGGTSAVNFESGNEIYDGVGVIINTSFVNGSVTPEPMEIKLSDETGVAGDTVDVVMSGVNLENIGAMNLYINYDDSKATYLGYTSDYPFVANGVSDRINVGYINSEGLDLGAGVLATFKFVIVAGNTNLAFDASSAVEDTNNVVILPIFTDGSVGEVVIVSTMILGDVSAVAGTQVVVPITGLKLNNIGSFNMDLLFDSAVLEFVEATNVVSGSLVGNAVGGTLTLGYANSEGLDVVDGPVADLVFNMIGGTSAISFDLASIDMRDTNLVPIVLTYTDGSVVELMIPSFVNTLPDTTVEVLTMIDYLYTGNHPGVADLTFSLMSGPSGSSLDSSGQFSFTPVNGQAGTYEVIAALSDGVTMVYDTASVTVEDGEVFVYEIMETGDGGNFDNDWYYNVSSAAGTITVADSSASAWGSHVVVFGDSAYTGIVHPQELALSNYTVDADIYVIGPADAAAPLYAGLAIRMAGSEFEYYRFIYRNSSSSNNGQLKLQGYDGSWHISAAWTPDVDFPALETGFHNFKVRVHEGEFECFIDGQLLPGGPYVDSAPFMTQGYPGIYKYNGGYSEILFDNFHVQATSIPEQKVVAINEIQGAGGESMYNGLAIKTTGIVTAAKTNNYFLQDSSGAWNGVFIYDNDNAPAVGDEVTLTSFVKEYYDKTELFDVYEFSINSSGNELPAPAVITASELGEAYEGVLVKIEAAEVTDPDLGYGQWELSDSTGSAMTDDVFYKSTPDSTAIVTLTGVGDFSFGNYVILPRDSADVFYHDIREGVMALDHSTGHLVASVMNNGSIGVNSFDDVSYGEGINWNGIAGLWRAGPVFGSAAAGTVNGQARDASARQFFDLANVSSDFTSGFTSETVGSIDFDQVSEAVINDELAPNPYGMNITQQTYSKTGEDVVYMRYGFENITASEVVNFSTGLFVDFDIEPYASNSGGFAMSEHLAYVYQTVGTTDPYLGVAALNGLTGGIVTSERHTDADALRADIFAYLTNGVDETVPASDDQRLCVGTLIPSIAVGETQWVTFAIVGGDNLHDIRANAEKAFITGKAAGFTDMEVGVDGNNSGLPTEYNISQNYPNPFNPTTVIQYALPSQSNVKINVYNTLGQLVTKLVNTNLAAGYHQVQFNASNLSSGVYFYSIQAEAIDGSKSFQIVKKMMLVK